LVWRPQPSAWYWLYASGWGLLVCVISFLVTIQFSRHGIDLFGLCEAELPSTHGSVLSYVLRPSIEEELLFRFLLCGTLLGHVSMRANIAINGVVFALVHIVLGGIGPDSAVAGFILAWAFLRSGSIVVPIAMHAAGNGLLFAVYHAELFRSLACTH
jgi:membrane protease YdiL (CAAX protease family)